VESNVSATGYDTSLPRRVDFVVVGLGAAGSSALSCLARAGARVVGIDKYCPPHDKGSSHGETRLLRVAYAEGEAYVPMVRRSIKLWQSIEERSGSRLFQQTGVSYYGPAANPFIVDVQEVANRCNVRLIDVAETDDLSRRHLAIPLSWKQLRDSEGGYLEAEVAIAALLRDAARHGAIVRGDCRGIALDVTANTITVDTTRGKTSADKIIVTTGAWINELIPALDAITYIERHVVHWFKDVDECHRWEDGFLPFLIATERAREFYGLPANARGEVKVSEHHFGERATSPGAVNRAILKADTDDIYPLVSRFLPALGDRVRSAVCMYPMSRDGHFIIDQHPREKRLVIGAGLSGHGFKFTPVIGEALANLAMDAAQEIDIGFFRLSRFPEFI
jgi:sarcosine oxidase